MTRELKDLRITDFSDALWDGSPWSWTPQGALRYVGTTYGNLPQIGGMSWPDGQGVQWRVAFDALEAYPELYRLQIGSPQAGFINFSPYPGIYSDGGTGANPQPGIVMSTYWQSNFNYVDAQQRDGYVYAQQGTTAAAGLTMRAWRDVDHIEVEVSHGDGWDRVLGTGYFDFGDDQWSVYAFTVRQPQTWHELTGVVVKGPPPTPSVLYQADAAGQLVNVGTAEHPLALKQADGTVRTWPGAAQPLYQKQPDGTWRKVIG